jgi:peptidoglycan hydrolase CwlO-like protein
MTPININIPESLTTQKAELETTLAGIASEEEKLATQRKDIQAALNTISSGIAILSGQTLPETKPATATRTTRKPMSDEARQRIAEGLRKSAQAKAIAKAAQGAAPEPQASAPEPADAQLVASVPQDPAQAPADVPVPDSPRGPKASRRAAKA